MQARVAHRLAKQLTSPLLGSWALVELRELTCWRWRVYVQVSAKATGKKGTGKTVSVPACAGHGFALGFSLMDPLAGLGSVAVF